jgi:hypothetical protein
MPLWLKRSIPIGFVLLIMIQIIRPARTNCPIDPTREISATFAVEPILASLPELERLSTKFQSLPIACSWRCAHIRDAARLHPSTD